MIAVAIFLLDQRLPGRAVDHDQFARSGRSGDRSAASGCPRPRIGVSFSIAVSDFDKPNNSPPIFSQICFQFQPFSRLM
jgi:hypothetical protein